MAIVNKKNGNILAEEYKLCTTTWQKARGLMFSKQKNLIFFFDKEEHVPLHMLFVFFPIDVLYLDENKRIVELKEDFRPFGFYSPKKSARYILELKKGTLRQTDTSLGDQLEF